MATDTHTTTTLAQDDVNGHMLVDDTPLKENALRFAAGGVILPPPDIKCVFYDLSSHSSTFL